MTERQFGLERGKVFPASEARALLNPLRHLTQPPGRLARRLAPAPDARVLDLGCGPGYFTTALAGAAPRGTVVGCDLQVGMLQQARARTDARPTGTARYARVDATSLPFRAGAFDAACCVTVLGEVPDRAACIAELSRVLRPGARLAIAEIRLDDDFLDAAEVQRLTEAAGFETVRRHGIRLNYTLVVERP